MLKNNLKSFRFKHEMNQKQFAEWLKVDVKLYNRWELQHGQPSLEMAIRISKQINCTVNDLFDLIE